MPDDPTTINLQLRQRAEEAAREVQEMASHLLGAGLGLQNRWDLCQVSGVVMQWPKYVLDAAATEQSVDIDGAKWPSAERIAKVLTDCHGAYEATHAAWQAIPEEKRGGLLPPTSRPSWRSHR
jgi:hypothetical protein